MRKSGTALASIWGSLCILMDGNAMVEVCRHEIFKATPYMVWVLSSADHQMILNCEIYSGPVIIPGSYKSYTKSEQVLSAPVLASAVSHLLAHLVYRLAVVCACMSRCDSENCWYQALCESWDGGKE